MPECNRLYYTTTSGDNIYGNRANSVLFDDGWIGYNIEFENPTYSVLISFKNSIVTINKNNLPEKEAEIIFQYWAAHGYHFGVCEVKLIRNGGFPSWYYTTLRIHKFS